MLCRHAMSVCLSVEFMYCVEINKHILKLFSPSANHTILVFPYQTLRQYSDGDPLTGAKIAIFDHYHYLALASITAGPSRVVNISTVEYRLNVLLSNTMVCLDNRFIKGVLRSKK